MTDSYYNILEGKRVNVTVLVLNPTTGEIELPDSVSAEVIRLLDDGSYESLSGEVVLDLIDGRPGLYGSSFNLEDYIESYSSLGLSSWLNFNKIQVRISVVVGGMERGYFSVVRSSYTSPYITSSSSPALSPVSPPEPPLVPMVFESAQSGLWQDTSTWIDSGTGLTPTRTPTEIDDVSILAGHEVSSVQSIAVNDLTVGAVDIASPCGLYLYGNVDVEVHGDFVALGNESDYTKYAWIKPGTGNWHLYGNFTLGNWDATNDVAICVRWYNGTTQPNWYIWNTTEPWTVVLPTIHFHENCVFKFVRAGASAPNAGKDQNILWFSKGIVVDDGIEVDLYCQNTNVAGVGTGAKDLYMLLPGGTFKTGTGSVIKASDLVVGDANRTVRDEGIHTVSDASTIWDIGASEFYCTWYFGIHTLFDGATPWEQHEVTVEIDPSNAFWSPVSEAQNIMFGVHHPTSADFTAGKYGATGIWKLLGDWEWVLSAGAKTPFYVAPVNNTTTFGSNDDCYTVLNLNGKEFTVNWSTGADSGSNCFILGRSDASKTHQHGRIIFNGGKLSLIGNTGTTDKRGYLEIANQGTNDWSVPDSTQDLVLDFTGGGTIDLVDCDLWDEYASAVGTVVNASGTLPSIYIKGSAGKNVDFSVKSPDGLSTWGNLYLDRQATGKFSPRFRCGGSATKIILRKIVGVRSSGTTAVSANIYLGVPVTIEIQSGGRIYGQSGGYLWIRNAVAPNVFYLQGETGYAEAHSQLLDSGGFGIRLNYCTYNKQAGVPNNLVGTSLDVNSGNLTNIDT